MATTMFRSRQSATPRARRAGLLAIAALLSAGTAFAAFSGRELFLPMVGRNPGVYPSQWYTKVWVHNPSPDMAQVTFYLLERNKANTAPLSYVDWLQGWETKAYDNVVETLFGVNAWGAIRIVADREVVVAERFYSITGSASASATDAGPHGETLTGVAERGSVGQYFAGIPAEFAIGQGETTEVLGVYQTQPAASSDFRYNFGFVESAGGAGTVRVSVWDGADVFQGSRDYTVRAYEQKQYAVRDHFPTLDTDNARITFEVLSGSCEVIAYGTGIANGSQDPNTFEATVVRTFGTITGVTAGQGLTGGGSHGDVTLDIGAGPGIAVDANTVSVANSGITSAMIQDATVASGDVAFNYAGAASKGGAAEDLACTTCVAPAEVAPGANGQVLTTSGGTAGWQALPAATGDISAVTAGAGLAGGGTSGDVSLSIATNGITSLMILDGTVGSNDVAFSFAGSSSQGGPASDVACTGCIGPAEVSAGSSGQVLTTTAGGAVAWQSSAGLSLPYSGSATSASPAFSATNFGAGKGLYGESYAGAGVHGVRGSASGLAPVVAPGVWGDAAGGIGVAGTSSSAAGVFGQSSSNVGVGGISASGYGVTGASTSNVGVYGTSSSFYGVKGESTGSVGVKGESTGNVGVYGVSSTSHGVKGESTSGTGVTGYSASNIGVGGTGLAIGVSGFSGTGTGVSGESSSGDGVSGRSNGTGVYGEATGATIYAKGVYGYHTPSKNSGELGAPDFGVSGKLYSSGDWGALGRSGGLDGNQGVYGYNSSYTGVSSAGVFGLSTAANGQGVKGEANNGTSAYAIWGVSSSGYAGYFSGQVYVSGTLSKAAGSFKIDHPLDPENRYLYHSFVESPDMMNIYNGNVVTGDDGLAVVTLPEWFEALNRDFRYQLTVIGVFAQAIVAEEVSGNEFTVRTDKPHVKVSWQVTGIRQDAYANAHRIPVEEPKPERELGTYLHPAAWGQPPDRDASLSAKAMRE